MLIFLLLLFSVPLLGQVEPIYSTLNGGRNLQISPGGVFLISAAFRENSIFTCEDRSEISGLPQAAYRGTVTVISDSLILVDGRLLIDVTARSAVDTLPYESRKIVTSVSPDRQRIVQLLDSGRVIVWRVADRQIEYDERHRGYDTVFFSGNAEHFLVADNIGNNGMLPLLLVRLTPPARLRAFNRSDVIGCVSPNADSLYTTTRGGQINVWDLRTDSLVRTSLEYYSTATGSIEVQQLDVDPTGSTMIMGGRKTAFVDLGSLSVRSSFEARLVQVSGDRTSAALVANNGLLRMVDVKTGAQVDSLLIAPITNAARNVACTEDLRQVVRLGQHALVAYDISTKSMLWQVDRVGPAIADISLSDDIILASPDNIVYTASTGEIRYQLGDLIKFPVFTRSINYDDHTRRFWYTTNSEIGFFDPSDSSTVVIPVATSWGGNTLAKRGEVLLETWPELAAYSTRSGQLLWMDSTNRAKRFEDSTLYLGDDVFIAYDSPNWLVIDIATGRIVQTIEPTTIPTVRGVVFTNDPSRILIRNTSASFLLWDIDEAIAIDTINNAYQANLLEGSIVRFVVTGDTSVYYDIRDQSYKTNLPTAPQWLSPVLSGNVLVVADETRYRFYEYSSGRELLSIEHTNGGDPLSPFYYNDDRKLFVVEHGQYGPFSVYDLTDHIVTSVSDDLSTDVSHSSIKVTLFPNPIQTSTSIIVQFSSTAQQQLQIVDLTGRVLRTFYGTGSLTSQQFSLDSQDLPQGVFFVRATDSAHSHTSILSH